MHLSIITPERIFFSGEAAMVTAPGTEGEFGVLPGHMPFVSTLKPGLITVESAQGTHKIAVLEGIAEVGPDHCVILSSSARAIDGLNRVEAQNELRAAEEAVSAAISDEDRQAAEKRLLMAQVIAGA